MLFHPKVFAPVVALSAMASTVLAHAVPTGGLTIQRPWSRETAVGQVTGGGFMTIMNPAHTDDRLLSGTSQIAAAVQLHVMTMDGGVMRMRQIEGGLAVPAKGKLELKPGSYHLMFTGLKRQLRQGERFPVTLRFQRAGTVTVQFAVQPVGFGLGEGSHAEH